MSEKAEGKQTTARERTAYHEAGHAVVNLALGRFVDLVSIVPDGASAGRCQSHGSHWTTSACPEGMDLHTFFSDQANESHERAIVHTYAGEIAERKFSGRKPRGSADGDYREIANHILSRWGNFLDAMPRLLELEVQAKALLDDPVNWAAVEAIAKELLQHEELDGDRVHEIYRSISEQHRQHKAG
jgi:hypothetical protein